MKNKRFIFGIIGCGNIGTALTEGLIRFAGVPRDSICAGDLDKSKSGKFKKKFGICILNNEALVKNSRFIIIAVKPKDVPKLCSDISQNLQNSSIIVSVAAGITIDSIRKFLKRKLPVIRLMPNLAIGHGKGLIGYCSKDIPEKNLQKLINTLSKLGFCFRVKEKDMFSVTVVAGSGPGFLFYLAELIYGFLKKKGFPDKVSNQIVAGLFEGTGVMLGKSAATPSLLKERVCSPGGTTLAGLSKLMEANISEIIDAAFQAAEKRAVELSGEK